MISWIDDNAIIGQENNIKDLKQALMNEFKCKDCGPMDKSMGCTINKLISGGIKIKLRQKELLQSYRDEFDIIRQKFNTPLATGTILKKPVKGDVILMPAKQSQYCSSVGNGMHMMQYSQPDMYNTFAIWQDTCQLQCKGTLTFDTMLRMMKYVNDTIDRGLVLSLMWKWNGRKDHEFIISGQIDSDYAKDMQVQKSVSGYGYYLKFEGAPVMFKSWTQNLVALSVCDAEQTAGVLCAQDMLYVWDILKSMGLKVMLPMLLEMDNKGTVFLANNWSIGGHTRHIDVQQCFLWELKESKVMDICWIKGTENNADVFTKNLEVWCTPVCIKN